MLKGGELHWPLSYTNLNYSINMVNIKQILHTKFIAKWKTLISTIFIIIICIVINKVLILQKTRLGQ